MTQLTKRPLGITLLALMFLWIGIVSPINFGLEFRIGFNGFDDFQQLLQLPFSIAKPVFIIAMILVWVFYAALGIGFWKLKNWARVGFFYFAILGTAFEIFLFIFSQQLFFFRLGMVIATPIFMGMIALYLNKQNIRNSFQ